MASDPVRTNPLFQERDWALTWLSFAWQGEADGAGGSQERRAYAEWLCHGAPPGLWSWIAEWLERDGIGPLNVFDTDDGPVEDHDLYHGEPGTFPPGFPYD